MFPQEKPSLHILAHSGVKGMKWGIRKDRYRKEYDSDQVLAKGSTVQNISSKNETNLNRPVYGATTSLDRLNYRGEYGSYLKEWSGSRTVYQNDLKVVKDIKIPSQQKSVELFKQTVAKDPEGMARSIARAKADVTLLGNFGKRFGMDAESRTFRDLQTKGEDWINTKGYAAFNKSLTSTKETQARVAYFDTLISKGYGGLRDTHDINNDYKSEDPVLIVDTRSLARGEARKLSMREIDAAIKDYEIKKQ